MIVYVVTAGEYSDYHIEAVFDKKQQAELYCAARKLDGDIEEWDTAEHRFDASQKKTVQKVWTARINARTGQLYGLTSIYTLDNISRVELKNIWSAYGCTEPYIEITMTLNKRVKYSGAKKIMFDRFAKWKQSRVEEGNMQCN